jgi:hypothetical protein
MSKFTTPIHVASPLRSGPGSDLEIRGRSRLASRPLLDAYRDRTRHRSVADGL